METIPILWSAALVTSTSANGTEEEEDDGPLFFVAITLSLRGS